MRCIDSIERIARRLEGDLPPDLARELEVHLVSCARCRAEERLQTLLRDALAAPPEAELSPDFTERVVANAFRTAPRAAPPSSLAWSLLAPALLASAAAVLWFLLGPSIARGLGERGASEWIERLLPVAQAVGSAGAEVVGLFAGLFRTAGAVSPPVLPLFVILFCTCFGVAWGVHEVHAWLRS